jgi:CRP-like cAMP-binding protein
MSRVTEADIGNPALDVLSRFKPELRRIPAGHDLVRQGDASTHLFAAARGWSYRYRLFGDGRRKVLGIVLPGEILCVSMPPAGRHSYSVRAATDAEFHALPHARLPVLLRENQAFATRLLSLLCQEAHINERLAIALGRCSAEETLAGFVLDLKERLERGGMLEPEDQCFMLPLSQAEIADHLGMTVVHLNRTLRRLEDDRVIAIRRGRVEILDEQRLRELSCLHEQNDDEREPVA